MCFWCKDSWNTCGKFDSSTVVEKFHSVLINILEQHRSTDDIICCVQPKHTPMFVLFMFVYWRGWKTSLNLKRYSKFPIYKLRVQCRSFWENKRTKLVMFLIWFMVVYLSIFHCKKNVSMWTCICSMLSYSFSNTDILFHTP